LCAARLLVTRKADEQVCRNPVQQTCTTRA
jgi:hypothetical protein